MGHGQEALAFDEVVMGAGKPMGAKTAIRATGQQGTCPRRLLQLQGAARSTVTLCPASWGGGGAGATTSVLIPDPPINTLPSVSFS